MAGRFADDIELALKRIGDGDPAAAADEYLADHRFDFLDRLAEPRVVARHVAPAEQDLALVLDRALDFVFARQPRSRFLRQEHHADAVLSNGRQFDALLGHFLAEKRVGNLHQDACAVTSKRVGAHRAAVGKVLQDLQPLLDDGVAFLGLDVRNKTDATGIVFVGGVV